MKIACVIPHYNRAATLAAVAAGAKRHLDDVLVVDDGSTDLPEKTIRELDGSGVRLIRRAVNGGKGAALLTAAEILAEEGFDFMIALDADGQHDPDDLPRFAAAVKTDPDSVVVGCRDFEHAENVPAASRFGRKFSDFWVKLETGVSCGDTQSGFRAYPVRALRQLKFHCRRYNFEIEVLVKLLWSGFRLRELPIRVAYAPPGRRISHFDPWRDNLRLSVLHTALILRRLLPIPFRRLVPKPRSETLSLLRHPMKFLSALLHENAEPAGLAAAAATGTLLAVPPLIGVHMAVILYVCIRLKLNKVMALAVQNLFMPPLSPFLCIEVGYFMRHGRFWTEFTLHNCVNEMHHRLYEWFLGSLILGPLFSALVWCAVYLTASHLRGRKS